jgi:hypothetical protein
MALCCSIGAQWLGLQSVAWATMLVKYSQHCSLKDAIVQTFDGDHPCEMCKHISKSRDTERKQEAQLPLTKADLICVTRQFTLMPRCIHFQYPAFTFSSDTLTHRPLLQPPRSSTGLS